VGVALATLSAMLFGLAGICIRIGMRAEPGDNGHFMSVLINCALIGLLVLFIQLPALTWSGVALFVLAGLATSFLGRRSSYHAIRLIGPTRQATLLVSAPVFAAVAGWAILGEDVGPLQAVGALLISAGLVVLVRSTAAELPEPATPGPPAAGTGALGLGFGIALLAACAFGVGHVLRKAALEHVPSVVLGSLIGVLTAMTAIMVTSALSARTSQLLEANFRRVPWWFVIAGLITTAAMLLQFWVLEFLAAWMVSLLQGTQVLWTLLLSWLFLRRQEPIDRYLLVSIALVVSGMTVVTLQV
jgi:drug/metabolite transporter (DMT)-like permease